MKFKTIILSLLSICWIQNESKGQGISVNAGMNISDMRFNLIGDGEDTSYNYGTGLGLRIGGEYTFNINDAMGVEGGLYFSQRKASRSESDEFETFDQNLTVNYIDIPVNFKYSIPLSSMKLNIKGGVLLGLALSGNDKGSFKAVDGSFDYSWDDKVEIGTDDELKRMDFGYNIGLGIEVSKINIGLNYNSSLGNIYDMTSMPDDESNAKWSVINLTVGYILK